MSWEFKGSLPYATPQRKYGLNKATGGIFILTVVGSAIPHTSQRTRPPNVPPLEIRPD